MDINVAKTVGVAPVDVKSEEAVIKALDSIDPSDLPLPPELAGLSKEELASLEKKVVFRLDCTLLTVISCLSIMNNMDRSSIANAKIGGLEEALNMTNHQYNQCLMIFYVGYILTQIPSNLILTRVHPGKYLACVAIAWGIVNFAQGFTTNFSGMMACRFLLGLLEAPFNPGYQLLMSCWYTRQELPMRLTWLYGANHMASAFGGLVAAGILGGMEGKGGRGAWSWLFILLGAVTIVLAFIAFPMLPSYPGTTSIFFPRELTILAEWRIRKENAGIEDIDTESVFWGLKQALVDPKLYMLIVLRIFMSNMGGFTNFFPSIVSTLGYSRTKTLLLTAPPWVFSVIVALAVSYSGARMGERGYHILGGAIASIVGNLLMMFVPSIPARYFSMFIVAGAGAAPHNLITSWEASTLVRPRAKRAAALALINTFSAGITHFYTSHAFPDSQKPRYHGGGTMMTVSSAGLGVMAMYIKWYLKRENKKMELMENDGVLGDKTIQGAKQGHGGQAVVAFRYVT